MTHKNRHKLNRQLAVGARVEREHLPTYKFIKKFYKKNKRLPSSNAVFKQIALNHLKENPYYYIKLRKANL